MRNEELVAALSQLPPEREVYIHGAPVTAARIDSSTRFVVLDTGSEPLTPRQPQ